MTAITRIDDQIDISPSEYNFSQTVQNIIDQLFANDVFLKQLYAQVFSEFNILEWASGAVYKYNDIVWYLSKAEVADAECDCPLHVLRCIKTDNDLDLDQYYPAKSFSSLGWKDLNAESDLLEKYAINTKLESYFRKIFNSHQEDSAYHKFGKLQAGNTSYLSKKLAQTDCMNLDSSRSNFKFPYKTYRLDPDENDAITYGICRVYDNGLMEYDLTFRLGYSGWKEVDSEYGLSAESITCNDIDFTDDSDASDYFREISDRDIFKRDSGKKSTIGDTVELNRTGCVNVYSAKLDFRTSIQIPAFKDNGYMVFAATPVCEVRDSGNSAISQSANSVVFCRKKTDSVTAMLIVDQDRNRMFSDLSSNATKSGLGWNGFHCQIIGRYM